MTIKANPTRIFLAIIVAAIVVRLVLVATLPMQAMTQMAHDDALFVHQAASIAQGQWLGTYNETTLIKGPGYPLFIAACDLIRFPLKLAEHLLYIGFCLMLLIALKPAIGSPRTRLIIFVVVLFNPMTVDSWMNRTLRESIYPAQTGLVIACAIGASLRYRSPRVWLWLAALGASLSWFWITREEGMWVLPGVAVLLGFGAIRAWNIPRGVRFIALCVIPIAMLILTINAVCFLNWRHYGVWEIVEMKSPELQSAYGALCRVKPDHFDPLVPVSRATREKIYSRSPTFAQLRPSLEGLSGRLWATLGASELPNLNGEIAGGWFVFALRDAVATTGHAHSAIEARDFYAKLASEVNAACDNGSLPALPRRASLAPPWNAQYVPLIARSALHGVLSLASFESLDIDVDPSVGDAAAIAQFSELTHGSATPVDPGGGGPQTVSQADNIFIEAWQLIGVTYQFALPWATGLALLVVPGQLVLRRSGYRSPVLIMELVLLMSIAARITMLSFLDVAFFPAINTRYLAPAYPLVLLFAVLTTAEGARIMIAMRSAGWRRMRLAVDGT
jgi:hypothetical protein